MATVGQCVQCGANIVPRARLYHLVKQYKRLSKLKTDFAKSAAELCKGALKFEAPQEADRLIAGAELPQVFQCSQCEVVYPEDVWPELALLLAALSGVSQNSESQTTGTQVTKDKAKLSKNCAALYKKLRVCKKCNVVYRARFLRGCPYC